MIQEIPRIESNAFYSIAEEYEKACADALRAARGIKSAQTRLRVRMSTISKLCKQVRKDVPPV